MHSIYCTHYFFFFFKQKTAYEMRISDWSSDVCSSDLRRDDDQPVHALGCTVQDDVLHGRGGDGDDREVDLTGDPGDRGIGGQAGDRVGGGVDRIDDAGEVSGDPVAHQARKSVVEGKSV